MYAITPELAAAELHALADAVRAAGVDKVRVYLSIGPDMFADEPERIAVVDRLAEAFGLTAETVDDGGWHRIAVRRDGGFTLRVDTNVSAPQRCVCGAACEHTEAVPA
ncbi:hypothetical protein [Dactylosporangium sp. CA-092794]|uniref:hypothetical protein n=1 Tax=Dactylosporangium sp. CA-092794 TaxID=3239929 RepID=UPI003D8ED7C6